jgi:hypothetical protein
MVVKGRDYDDTVYCIDEPELHMNSRLQSALLGELYQLLNDESQLWIATHSIRMMRKAKDLAESYPGKVVFLDFDNLDFDIPQTLTPIEPDRTFWKSTLRVALGDLAELVAPKQVVICEGVPQGASDGPNVAHDTNCLDVIFFKEFPDAKFLAGGNCYDVRTNKHALIGAIEILSEGTEIIRIIDRDDHSEQEVGEFRKVGVRMLSLRNLESYLFDDEVLTALCETKGQPEKSALLIEAKKHAVEESVKRGNPPDDIKRAADQIYKEVKRTLKLTGTGNDVRAFMRSTLAPLVRPGMNIYDRLKKDIFGE